MTKVPELILFISVSSFIFKFVHATQLKLYESKLYDTRAFVTEVLT